MGWLGAILRITGHSRLTGLSGGRDDTVTYTWLLQRAHSNVHVATTMTFPWRAWLCQRRQPCDTRGSLGRLGRLG